MGNVHTCASRQGGAGRWSSALCCAPNIAETVPWEDVVSNCVHEENEPTESTTPMLPCPILHCRINPSYFDEMCWSHCRKSLVVKSNHDRSTDRSPVHSDNGGTRNIIRCIQRQMLNGDPQGLLHMWCFRQLLPSWFSVAHRICADNTWMN
jgi:hypothetical protein